MSFSYQTTTISELMSELDTLGGTSRVKMNSSHLTALINNNLLINHYSEKKDYLTWESKKKKYHYDLIAECFHQSLTSTPCQYYEDGFNVTIIVYGNILQEILNSIYQDQLAINHFLYPMEPTQPIISLLQQQSMTKSSFYEWDKHIKIQYNKNEVTLTKIVSKTSFSSQLRIISLPQKMFSQTSQCKTQLVQLLDALNKNIEKSGKEVANRLFMKRHKIVNMFIENVFDDNLNFIIHDCSKTNETILDFFNKFNGLSNFSLKISEGNEQTMSKIPINHSNTTTKSIKTTHPNENTNTKTRTQSNKNELEYCRKLQRKTHKYSIPSPQSSPSPSPAPYPVPSSIKNKPPLSSSEEIQLLKCEHLVQISKYHETIQSLNSKILILSKQNNTQELCSIYEKQIMLLELRIQEMREDISSICSDSKDQLKSVIKRLNEQLRNLEKHKSNTNNHPNTNVNANRLKEVQKKLKESEEVRHRLLEELKTINQRLQVREKQITELNTKLHNPLQSLPTLSVSSQKQLMQLNRLLNQLNSGNGQSYIFIKNKLQYLFRDLHESKVLLQECSQFLVDLQRKLQQKIEQHDANVVLDTNRFIRGFLLKIVQIKQ